MVGKKVYIETTQIIGSNFVMNGGKVNEKSATADGVQVSSKEISGGETNEWKYSFTGLPKYNKGKEIMYTIDEEEVADYTKKVDGYNLINTHIPKTIDTKPESSKEHPKTGDNILMNVIVFLISIITGLMIIKKKRFN